MTNEERIAEAQRIYLRGQLDACSNILETVTELGADLFTVASLIELIRHHAEMARPNAYHVPER